MAKGAGWVGGNKWRMTSSFGSRTNNSFTPSRRRSTYACGTPRAYVGDIQAELWASWAAKRRKA